MDKLITDSDPVKNEISQKSNVFISVSETDLKEFVWIREPLAYHIVDNSLEVRSERGTNYFISPADPSSVDATGPIFCKEVFGDFVATTLVKPDFNGLWNAASLMVYIDDKNWIKLAFENSDATGKSVVTVVTKDVSDDANGVVLTDQDSVWLRIIRQGGVYGLHWSIDGKEFYKTRICKFLDRESVMVGLEAQCPVEDSGLHKFLFFSIDQETTMNVWDGE